ncbi:hypothetical protein PAXRUDRAFT_96639, partial [Paxillus rubicundulus Ve08.2h10]
LHHFDLDPTPNTLSFYITYASHHIEPRSVMSYLTGIIRNLELHFPHAQSSQNSHLVTRTLQGCLHQLSMPTIWKSPLTCEHLRQAVLRVPAPHSHDDCLFLAQLHTGFFTLLCLGELVVSDTVALRDSFSVSHHTSVRVSPTNYSFDLHCDKSDRLFKGSTILIQKSSSEPNPHTFFSRYLSSRDAQFPFHPQLWLCADGFMPTRAWFIHQLHHIFPTSIAGDSMRARGATPLAAAG